MCFLKGSQIFAKIVHPLKWKILRKNVIFYFYRLLPFHSRYEVETAQLFFLDKPSNDPWQVEFGLDALVAPLSTCPLMGFRKHIKNTKGVLQFLPLVYNQHYISETERGSIPGLK